MCCNTVKISYSCTIFVQDQVPDFMPFGNISIDLNRSWTGSQKCQESHGKACPCRVVDQCCRLKEVWVVQMCFAETPEILDTYLNQTQLVFIIKQDQKQSLGLHIYNSLMTKLNHSNRDGPEEKLQISREISEGSE